MRAINGVVLSAAATVAVLAACSVTPRSVEDAVPDLALDSEVEVVLPGAGETGTAHLLGDGGGATHYVALAGAVDDAPDDEHGQDADDVCFVVVLDSEAAAGSACGTPESFAARGAWIELSSGVTQESAVAYLAPFDSDLDAIPEGVDWYETPGGAAVITEDLTAEQWDAIVG